MKDIIMYRAKGITADGAVVGEPTGLDIVIAHKGVYRFQLNTPGKSVQSSKPQNERYCYTMICERYPRDVRKSFSSEVWIFASSTTRP